MAPGSGGKGLLRGIVLDSAGLTDVLVRLASEEEQRRVAAGQAVGLARLPSSGVARPTADQLFDSALYICVGGVFHEIGRATELNVSTEMLDVSTFENPGATLPGLRTAHGKFTWLF